MSYTIVPRNSHLEPEFLSKSLGLAMKKTVDDPDDPRVAKEWQLYQEMLKASKDSLEKRGEDEEARLETVLGRERAKAFKNSLLDRRRSVAHLHSAVGRRRVRSQASRRDKLTNQGLQSHRRHQRVAVSETIY
ncbi:uncharacterized protein LOC113226027 [Hyposmocoma kahamanoa]|uniref:uncharacterized protein LOC113226027 n=1 Tax=Hyposmocoma kahamanoa TaxID=1477025 RepID=UPI000E6DA2FF|nr:uncharacterized protein LOC113226027 [Hyposmocoma kahamanoa]